eukprot:Clim_evm3s220 gene=Clim_evmTU3s220
MAGPLVLGLLIVGPIMGGCCANVFTLEVLTNIDPKSGNLITAAQFLAVTIISGIWYKFQPRKSGSGLPYWAHLAMVVMFFILSVTNNAALHYNIPIPLHMIFRSGSLLTNIVARWAFIGQMVSPGRLLGAIGVSIGVVLCTIASLPSSERMEFDVSKGFGAFLDYSSEEVKQWSMGLGLLTIALVLSSILGVLQEVVYGKYGAHNWIESLFFLHLLSLPGFFFMADDIVDHLDDITNYSCNDMQEQCGIHNYLNFTSDYISDGIVALALNSITQFVCIAGVFMLTAQVSSPTVTLVLTLRKFSSLMISKLWFGHPFAQLHYAGIFLVLLGTLLYGGVFQTLISTPVEDGIEKKKKQ